MPITQQQLLQILPNAGPRAGIFLPALNRAMARYKIDSRLRQAAFLAQIGHESGQLRYTRELGGNTYLAKYDTGTLAKRLGNTPEADGDGQKYCGRGLLQITGRENYRVAGKALSLPLLDQPEQLEQPEWAAISAAWWWFDHGLNDLADAGRFQDTGSIINTGQVGRVPHGAAERQSLYARALKVLA